jgi:ribosomal protein S18 acetylase RimI-like enzyme
VLVLESRPDASAGSGARKGRRLPFEGVEVALDGGLVLREAGERDVDRLAAFNASVHRMPGQTTMATSLGTAVRSLMEGHLPGAGAAGFLVVDDPGTGAVASSLCLLRQTWRYEGIPFDVGQIEFVGTDPAYRRRGLVRIQMDLVHRRSAAEGCLVQVIDGIDWYYRQFGYEYALEASRGGRVLEAPAPPAAAGGQDDALRTRTATAGDLDFLSETYRSGMERYEVSVDRDQRRWLADLDGYDRRNYHRPTLRVIEDRAGRAAGFCSYWASFHDPGRTPDRLWVGGLELDPDHDWATWGPRAARCLQEMAVELAADRGMAPTPIVVRLGDAHPFYDLGRFRRVEPRDGSVWYVRVADVPGFLHHVGPALQERLANSPAAGHSGTLALSFYRDGVRLHFELGRLVGVERWPAPGQYEGDAWFPELTFLQLLLGYRSLAELEHAYADCAVRDLESRTLVEALFPKRPSHTWLAV